MIDGIPGGMSMNPEMIAQMREKMFAKLDGDGDGMVSKDEFEAMKPPGPPPGQMPPMAEDEQFGSNDSLYTNNGELINLLIQSSEVLNLFV